MDLLRALVDEDATGMATVLLESDDLGVRRSDVRRTIAQQQAAPGAPTLDSVLDYAMLENPTRPIGTDHLLIALLEADNATADLLAASGITTQAVRAVRATTTDSQCYGCTEADARPTRFSILRPNLPPELTAVLHDVEHWRREKEAAVDASDFERAAHMRDQEKTARRSIATWDESTLIAQFGSAIDEVLRLRAAVDYLTTQLHDGHAATGPVGGTADSPVE
ncbi:Clp protease N-terminal domain-containing protein [Nocardia sp. NPDC051833]|uniref:UvrB/UvrC motif-containing protein n=1 Tax=Nocardia sp. NPDC051833 TaxID=3155674 RepID=UPI0034458032